MRYLWIFVMSIGASCGQKFQHSSSFLHQTSQWLIVEDWLAIHLFFTIWPQTGHRKRTLRCPELRTMPPSFVDKVPPRGWYNKHGSISSPSMICTSSWRFWRRPRVFSAGIFTRKPSQRMGICVLVAFLYTLHKNSQYVNHTVLYSKFISESVAYYIISISAQNSLCFIWLPF